MIRPRKLLPLCLACVLLVSEALATTLLTNGVPAIFGFHVTRPTLFNGQFGYAIYVPPGATRLTIVLVPSNPTHVVQLLVRREADVGFGGTGTSVQDFVGTAFPAGVKEVIVTPQSSPPLQSGTYFIGFDVATVDQPIDLSLTATVEGGSVPPVRTVAISTFDSDLDGWTANTASTGLEAASQGDADSSAEWQASGGTPGGYARHNEVGGPALDALVAPAKFLGNLSELVEARFEFDFKQIAGSESVLPVEIRIFGAGTAFSWVASMSPPPPDAVDYPLPPSFPPGGPPQNPPTGPTDSRWRHYTAVLSAPLWTRITGTARFVEVLANLQRVEVLTDLALAAESSGIDNFALLSRGVGPPATVLPGNTSFLSGADGWTRNFPPSELAGATTGDAGSTFRWSAFEGNPTGHIRLNEAGGANRDYVVAPARFLGTYRGIENPQFEFDYLHSSFGTPTLPVEMRLAGAQSVFVWTGAVPSRTWTHYIAPLREALWQRVSGAATFADALANVERLEISMDQADGPETNAIDNFWVLPASAAPAPPALSANPLTLSFSALVRDSNPAPQAISVTSIGGGPAVSFDASATGGNWLKISAASGVTPRTLNVWPDVTGLAEGTYSGRITVVPGGSGMATQTVNVSLTVAARPGPTPRVASGGIVNAASNRAQLAPGSLGTLYGSGLGPAQGITAAFVAGSSTLPTRVQGVRVLVNEVYGALISEAPLLYVSDSQINFQLPFEAIGRSEVRLVVDNNGNLSTPVGVQVLSSAPGVFTYGENRAVAVNQNGSVNSAQNAAPRGSVLTVYMTGQGVVTPPVPTGAAAPARPLVRSPLPARAWIGGEEAQLLFVGLTPGLVGVLQVNLTVPFSAPSGDSPLVLNIGGWNSNPPLVSIR